MSHIVAFGELLLRLTTTAGVPGFGSGALTPSFCGAEANVAVNLAGLGHRAAFISVIPDNPLGLAALREMQVQGVTTQCLRLSAGRIGVLFLEPGCGARPARVTYDRAGSAFAKADPDSFDWDEVLSGDSCLIASGITAALGPSALASLRAAFQAADRKGATIAFDCNFRPALWRGREDAAPQILRELCLGADILFAGRRAIALITGQSFDDGDDDAQFGAAARTMFDLSPRLRLVAATRREIVSADHHRLTALVADRSSIAVSRTVEITSIVDRVGTGDAFASGVLHAVIGKRGLSEMAEWGLACSRWSHSVAGDFLRAAPEDIEALISGIDDVRR